MFRTIIVPLDGSAFAEQALPLGVRLARRAGAALHLVQAHVPYPIEGVDTGKWDNKVRQQERTYLAHVAERVAAVAGATPCASLIGPDPVRTIPAYAGKLEEPLVVMTSHGRTGLSRLWLGSVADGVIRAGTAPVLLVRPVEGPAPALDPAGPLFARILVPLDGSERAEAVLPSVSALATLGPAAVHLLRIVEPIAEVGALGLDYVEPIYPAELTEEEVRRAREYVQGAADRLRSTPGVDAVTTDVRVARRSGGALLEAIGEWKPDLVALATHGRGASRFLLGSTADKMIRGVPVPVLVVRGAEKPTAEEAAVDESGVEAMLMF